MVSSLQGVIMQLGGALGVAFLGTMLERSQTLYTSLYGESLGASRETYGRLWYDLQGLAQRQGLDPATVDPQAQALLGGIIQKQALVSAFDHTFIIAGLICAVGIPLVLWLKVKRP
jgi:DHA2 family multidrug resistance protein